MTEFKLDISAANAPDWRNMGMRITPLPLATPFFATTPFEEKKELPPPDLDSAGKRPLRAPREQGIYRNAVYTLNNPTEEEYAHLCAAPYTYQVIGKEVAPTTGTIHLQGYIEFDKQYRFKRVKEILGVRTWFEARRGTPKEASDYCKEDGHFVEDGHISKPGAASTLYDIQEQINGGATPDDIVNDSPHLYHQYGRTIERMFNLHVRRQWRTEAPTVYWLHGGTGFGKSHECCSDYTPDTHYILPNDEGWWDEYRGQRTVILNDYRGTEMHFNQLLQLLDKWPYFVRQRNKAPRPFNSPIIYITSSMSPTQLYPVGGPDDVKQLLRRITEVREVKSRGPVVTVSPLGNSQPMGNSDPLGMLGAPRDATRPDVNILQLMRERTEAAQKIAAMERSEVVGPL